RSICACLAQPRSVSALIPSSPPTFRQAAVTLASWSLTRSSTSRTARSRSSSGYFRTAPIVPLSRGLGASTKPGAIHSFCADALSSTVNLNVDLDVMLCVLAQALLAALRARLPGYAAATPDTIQRRFLETPGQIITTADTVTVRLDRRA